MTSKCVPDGLGCVASFFTSDLKPDSQRNGGDKTEFSEGRIEGVSTGVALVELMSMLPEAARLIVGRRTLADYRVMVTSKKHVKMTS